MPGILLPTIRVHVGRWPRLRAFELRPRHRVTMAEHLAEADRHRPARERVYDRAAAAAIRAVHPYEVPEIIGLDVSAAHVPYLNWIAEMTTGRVVDFGKSRATRRLYFPLDR